ncbi:hypothetical protein [Rhodoferax fermentans]|uniref:Uncharacterized protein n=1 Tax=Rhodoferax fermentans TaxID=28066 RepID=A0A1T1ANS8_RHOFE|nr:hypothetical protein [Rhodoferax fermentans]MBK1685519.1 hypothetical protein [Rhodoferax fermentans]OOV05643.1 hypothetical protein RF819_01995 [Rhodoferax fermentans]
MKLEQRLQVLEAKGPTNRAEEDRQIDALMKLVLAQVALIPPAPGDLRTPEQRFSDALTAETETDEAARLLDSLPSLGLTPALRRSLMKDR